MLKNKLSVSLIAFVALFFFTTACSGEYEPAREIHNNDSSALPDSSANHMDHSDSVRNR
jgi:hypothetical protein